MSNLTPAECRTIARDLAPDVGPAFMPAALAIAEAVASVLVARLAVTELDRAASGRGRATPGRALPPTGGEGASYADDVWLNTAQVVEYAKCSTVTVHRHAAAGTLRSTSGGRGRNRRYRRAWVDAWLETSPRLPPRGGRRG